MHAVGKPSQRGVAHCYEKAGFVDAKIHKVDPKRGRFHSKFCCLCLYLYCDSHTLQLIDIIFPEPFLTYLSPTNLAISCFALSDVQ